MWGGNCGRLFLLESVRRPARAVAIVAGQEASRFPVVPDRARQPGDA
ncbi:MAG: hypothetical protein ACLT2T_14250 [Bilophila wadsworthia]